MFNAEPDRDQAAMAAQSHDSASRKVIRAPEAGQIEGVGVARKDSERVGRIEETNPRAAGLFERGHPHNFALSSIHRMPCTVRSRVVERTGLGKADRLPSVPRQVKTEPAGGIVVSEPAVA